MLAHKIRIAAAALSIGAMAFLAPADARGFGGFRGGISGFHGGGTMRGFGQFVGTGYSGWAYDSAYPTSPYDQGVTQTSPSHDSAYATSYQSVTQTSPLYDDPYNVSRASRGGCSLLIKVEKSGDQFINRRIPLC
jgi:hypothetical protein